LTGGASFKERARAKLNLCLHVGARGADGYHRLASLVAFADAGDVLEARPAAELSLALAGPFGASLAGEADNLVLRAARALQAEAAATDRAPAGAAITAGFAFDVPVRFAEDRLNVARATFMAGAAPSVPLIELREDD